jgi:hypothetical protein
MKAGMKALPMNFTIFLYAQITWIKQDGHGFLNAEL